MKEWFEYGFLCLCFHLPDLLSVLGLIGFVGSCLFIVFVLMCLFMCWLGVFLCVVVMCVFMCCGYVVCVVLLCIVVMSFYVNDRIQRNASKRRHSFSNPPQPHMPLLLPQLSCHPSHSPERNLLSPLPLHFLFLLQFYLLVCQKFLRLTVWVHFLLLWLLLRLRLRLLLLHSQLLITL